MQHIVIIGNGIAGVTAARNLRKRSNHTITIVSSETKYFFSRTALMYVYMGHMKFEHTQPYENWFWKKNKINLLKDRVDSIDFDNKTLIFNKSANIQYDQLILAVGSKPNKFGWPGQELPGVQGLYSKQDLDLLEENTHPPFTKPENQKVKHAIIVGGGLIGVELAEMLSTRNIKSTFLVREERFWGNVLPEEEGKLIERHMKEHHIDIKFNTELKEIIPGEDGRVDHIITKAGEKITCQFVGLTAGVRPNISFLRELGIEIQRGIMVNRYLETNIPDVYAIGDCAQFHEAAPGRRPIEQVWYSGKMMGEIVAKNITGKKEMYSPGYWFNSAKFFDIEYQTYGTVLPQLPEGQTSFYWEHSDGKKCLKIIFEKKSKKFIGLNVSGIRLRHEMFNKWLKLEKTVEFILEHLKDANFDPEFYTQYEDEIISKFNRENKTTLKPKAKSWIRIFQ